MRYQKKEINDKFYTSRPTAKKLVSHIDLTQYDLVIEPSAGDGAFVDAIKNMSVLAMDILPGRSDIYQKDFFSYRYDGLMTKDKILVIGNPPFGKQNNLACKFFNHAANIADTIAFILPLSFKKDSVQNKLDLNFSLSQSFEIEDNAYRLEGKPYNVPTVFQIWKRGPVRIKAVPDQPVGWKYTAKDDAHFAIRRVGYYAGRAYLDYQDKNEESFLFVKLMNEPLKEYLVEHLNCINWPHNDTVGPRTISKTSLNKFINGFFVNFELS